ncbi:MAG: polysaccharide deacetylase family protein [Steroidobacteraceae bacterium]|jgi:polysaccharide deacetylase
MNIDTVNLMPTNIWPMQRACAISLTYDDGLAGHAREIAPALADIGLPATFFVPIESDLIRNTDRWKRVAEMGHELGNHTVFHPCHKSNVSRGDFRNSSADDRSWVEPCFDLGSYTESRFRRELGVASGVLTAIDGQCERTYGNTCFETSLGPASAPISMSGVLRPLFVAARGRLTVHPAKPGPDLDLFDVGTIQIDGQSVEQLQRIVDGARVTNGWAVLTAHGVGPADHELYVDEEAHWRFARWLRSQADVWVATFIDVARHTRGIC